MKSLRISCQLFLYYTTPIGTPSKYYTGNFDGQGHTVSGLYFNNDSTNGVGLFRCLGENGEIKNVGVIDSYFYGYWSVGGVCGYNGGGTITGCYNTGTVSGSGDNVGGVCGYNGGGTITGCYNTGTVSGNDPVGGICGRNESGGTVIGCYNTGTVSGNSIIGGVCGYNGLTSNSNTITGCYNTGTVSGNNNIGGVCGVNRSDATITGCYTNSGKVCGADPDNAVTDCDVKLDEKFADSTVCKLLDTALQNASSDVRFCQRIGKDASPLLTYQFDSIDDHTDKNPKDHICDICGETLSTHTGGEATCTAKAECEYCGEEYGELANHSLSKTDAKEATCTEDGNIEYWTCSVCHKLFSDENGTNETTFEAVTVNATGHPLTKTEASAATCTEDGNTAYWTCSVCNKYFSDENGTNEIAENSWVIKAAHKLTKIEAQAATVTETGNEEYWHCENCKKYFADEKGEEEISPEDTVIQKLPPEIIEGKGQSITAGEKKALTFRSNALFEDFKSVKLDGDTLDTEYYTAESGSIIVTLDADYVATLPAGEHTIGIVSESGTAETTFTVAKKAAPGTSDDSDKDSKADKDSVKTGDDTNLALWLALMLLSGAGITGVTAFARRKRTNE